MRTLSKTNSLLGLALLLLPAASPAQQTIVPADPAPDPAPIAIPGERLYLVEVIVFNNLGPIPAGGEIWHREPRIEFDPDKFMTPQVAPAPGTGPLQPVLEVSPGDAATEADLIQFTELSNLATHLSKLHTDHRYEVVTYSAWVQPLFEKRDAVRVPIMRETPADEMATAIYPPVKVPLSGDIRIFENRLLFVDVDVSNEFSDGYSGFSMAARGDRPPGKYTLREKRRVKLNELHYFDHPFFGILVRVSRHEPMTDSG